MTRLLAAASFAVIGLAACTQAEPEKTETKVVEVPGPTVVETREVQVPAVVVERDTPPVVIERDRRGDSTTVRAGPDGVEVETTNR